MTELEKLKYWLDTEITLMHIAFYILLGTILDTKKWWVVMGGLIFTSFIYLLKRIAVLAKADKKYLSTPKLNKESEE